MHSITEKVKTIEKLFGVVEIARDGENIAVRCPNRECSSRKGSGKRKYSINILTLQSHCWVCELRTKGSLKHVIRKHVGSEGLQIYLKVFNEKIDLKEEEIEEAEKIVVLPDDFALINTNNIYHKNAVKYLEKRGIKKPIIKRYRMGLSREPGWKGRIIIPSFNSDGELNMIVGRGYYDNVFPKYKMFEVPKRDVVFNEIDINWKKELMIVEGPLDLVKAGENSTCMLGSYMDKEFLLFRRIVVNKTPIILALDNDAKKKEIKIAKKLNEYNIKVKIFKLQRDLDVGGMELKEVAKRRQLSKEWSTKNELLSRISAL